MAASGRPYRLRFATEQNEAESDETAAQEDRTGGLQDEEDEEEGDEEVCEQLPPEEKGVDKANFISKLFWW